MIPMKYFLYEICYCIHIQAILLIQPGAGQLAPHWRWAEARLGYGPTSVRPMSRQGRTVQTSPAMASLGQGVMSSGADMGSWDMEEAISELARDSSNLEMPSGHDTTVVADAQLKKNKIKKQSLFHIDFSQ